MAEIELDNGFYSIKFARNLETQFNSFMYNYISSSDLCNSKMRVK